MPGPGRPNPQRAALPLVSRWVSAWISGARTRMWPIALSLGLLAAGLAGAADLPAISEPTALAGSGQIAAIPAPGELERRRAIVGRIGIEVDKIFNEADPLEDRALYRLANRLHRHTRDEIIRAQVLLKTGEPYSVQRAQETARILRGRNYLYDAAVELTAYDPNTNTVDLLVRVRDVWTLSPGINISRSGGEDKSVVRLVDSNFLGRGQYLAAGYTSNVDRSGVFLNFRDQNLFQSWWAIDTAYIDASDGSTVSFALKRPFYSLDTRWSAGTRLLSQDQITTLYDLGEEINEFRQQNDFYGVEGGLSRGLIDGWTTRWLAGFRYERSLFEDAGDDGTTVLLPEDRTLSYPWVGVELIQDRFETTRNQDQIGRTEDVFLGKSLRLDLGWSAPAFGADRSAGIFALSGRLGNYVGQRGLILLGNSWTGRLESGNLADSLLSVETRYYLRFNERNVFTAAANGQRAVDLDLDHQLLLGGDSGLRGYPLRYQNGDYRALVSVEQRHYTDWFPYRLFRVGGAVFADAGRTWGDAPLASPPLGWLYDVGFGLRLGNARSGQGNVVYLDLAFPLGAPSDIDSVQFLVGARVQF